MNKRGKLITLFLLSFVFQFMVSTQVDAYTINQTYNQVRVNQATTNKYIVLHETGTYAPAVNNAIFFNREWRNVGSYTSFVVGDGGQVYQVSPTGLVQWGAGSEANYNSPVQIELARTTNPAQFQKDYKAYIDLTRNMARQYNIPLTLDGSGNGVKSHYWFTLNFWGDHTDPYGYLSSMGVSKAQLQKDLYNGVGGQTTPEKPSEPKPTPPKPNNGYQSVNGSFKFTYTTKIRNGVGVSGQYTGVDYQPGETVNYDRIYKNVDGYDWASYVSYSGTRHYVAMIGANTNPAPSKPTPAPSGEWKQESGTFYPSSPINLRTAPVTGNVISTIFQNQSIKYDAHKVIGNQVWVRQPRGNGQYGYMCVRQDGIAWGVFK